MVSRKNNTCSSTRVVRSSMILASERERTPKETTTTTAKKRKREDLSCFFFPNTHNNAQHEFFPNNLQTGVVGIGVRFSRHDCFECPDGRHGAERVEQNDDALRRDWTLFPVRRAIDLRANHRIRCKRGVRVRGGGEGVVEEVFDVAAATRPSTKNERRRGEDERRLLRRERGQNILSVVFSPIFLQAFLMTFLAEWGDRSQIATVALAADYDPIGVTIGGIYGHAACTSAAVLGGKRMAGAISERMVGLCGGVLFLAFGVHALIVGE